MADAALGRVAAADIQIAKLIADEAPNFVEAVNQLVSQMEVIFVNLDQSGRLTGEQGRAQRLIANQMLNDQRRALAALLIGDGRSAMSTARSCFEHMVNYRTCANDAQEADRFFGQQPVVEMQMMKWMDPIIRADLDGKELKSYEHHQRKFVNKTRPKADQAISQYGNPIKRGFSSKTLRDRADQYGLGDHYDFYRAASAFVHGSSFSALGTSFDFDESTVHRFGPAITACVYPFLACVTFFDLFLDSLEHDLCQELSPARSANKKVLDMRLEYEQVLSAVEGHILPERTPVLVPTIAVSQFQTTWYLVDPETNRLVRAENPELSDHQRDNVNSWVSEVQRSSLSLKTTLFHAHICVKIKAGSIWQERREGWQIFSEIFVDQDGRLIYPTGNEATIVSSHLGTIIRPEN